MLGPKIHVERHPTLQLDWTREEGGTCRRAEISAAGQPRATLRTDPVARHPQARARTVSGHEIVEGYVQHTRLPKLDEASRARGASPYAEFLRGSLTARPVIFFVPAAPSPLRSRTRPPSARSRDFERHAPSPPPLRQGTARRPPLALRSTPALVVSDAQMHSPLSQSKASQKRSNPVAPLSHVASFLRVYAALRSTHLRSQSRMRPVPQGAPTSFKL